MNNIAWHSLKLPFVAYFLSRLILININEAEFTDGYQLLTWSFENPVRWHPLYPILVKSLSWMIQPEIAGRLISIFSGFGAMIVLSAIAKKLYGEYAAPMMQWLYVVSPLFYWMNLRVLTESTFQLLFFGSVYYVLLWVRKEKGFSAPAFLFLSGLACLTRPEGYVFVPIVAYVLFKEILANRGVRSFAQVFVAMAPWIFAFFWSFIISASDSYSEVMTGNLVEFQWHEGFTRLISYIDVYPYILFYPLFPFALYHLLRGTSDRIWKWFLVYFHVLFAAVLFVHPAWSTRFLMIPVSLLLIDVAAALSVVRRPLQGIVLVGCFAFSVSAVFLQKQMFNDFKQAAKAVKGELPDNRVVSDEQAKTNYYLGKPVIVYNRNEELRPGDVLILHSYNTDLNNEKKILDERYGYRALFSTDSTIVPLLANAALERIQYANSPIALMQRFQKQNFQTVVILIETNR